MVQYNTLHLHTLEFDHYNTLGRDTLKPLELASCFGSPLEKGLTQIK